MRTTVDLPDGLYRTLKPQAAWNGETLRDLARRQLEQGFAGTAPRGKGRRGDPPVAIPKRGVPIPAVSRARLHALEAAEDQAKHERSPGR